MKNYYFVGILGSGMSALARIQVEMGNNVGGSDRNLEVPLFYEFKKTGMKIYPQDGSGIEAFARDSGCALKDIVVVKSTAIEDTVKDIVEARRLGIAEEHRSDLLAEIFNCRTGIAVGGTAGKTSVSTMCSYLLDALGKSPSFVIGGISRNFNVSSRYGKSDYFVIESDESDGTIIKYKPAIAILTNISKEHKELPELFDLFGTFISNVREGGSIIASASCPNVSAILRDLMPKYAGKKFKIINYEYSKNINDFRNDYLVTDIEIKPYGTFFKMNGAAFETSLIGRHNIENLAVSIATAAETGVSLGDIALALKGYKGVARRLEVIGVSSGTVVIDDYAHNPHEIECAISAVRVFNKPVIAVYQPHGYGPTFFTRHELRDAFVGIGPEDEIFISEIYYAGGTVNKNISSAEVIGEIKSKFNLKNVYHAPYLDRLTDMICDRIFENKSKEYIVLVMGARNVNTICPRILERVSGTRSAFVN
ncbi:MAG TPA: Mur ligase family protein [Candidatus Wallbacteria bacterium]|nr:Mur ligase family protein [Candidatus Wallbacteria bacterium]